MFKELYELAKQLLGLAQDMRQNKAEIKELRQELRELSAAVQWLGQEIRRVSENDAHERDKLVLSLENQLLKNQRALPPKPRIPKKRKKEKK